MKLKILFFILLVYSTNLISQENDPYRLPHKVEPVYQIIRLELDPDKDEYIGNTSIDLQIQQNVSTFRLHGKDFVIEKIALLQGENSIGVDFSFEDYGLLRITPDKELVKGKYKLLFTFKGKYNRKGEGINKFTKDSLKCK